MTGNCHVRFLEGRASAMGSGYSILYDLTRKRQSEDTIERCNSQTVHFGDHSASFLLNEGIFEDEFGRLLIFIRLGIRAEHSSGRSLAEDSRRFSDRLIWDRTRRAEFVANPNLSQHIS
jgi:hypothetical protein